MAARKRTPNNSIFQLKVTLRQVKPAVWRRLLVPADVTLAEFHYIINEAMGWTCSHLHSFSIGKRTFGDPELDPDGELKYENEREATLASLADVGQKLTYLYDFGDDWYHDVSIEKRLAFDTRISYPLCIAGARACPPEDCHGPHGYQELVEAIRDEKHTEHDEILAWVGGYFDPEGFDPNRTNTALREMYEFPDCESSETRYCEHDHSQRSNA